MPHFALIGIPLLLFVFPASKGLAQTEASLPPATSELALPSAMDVAPAVFPPPVPPPSRGWSLDLLVGLPTGVRAQARLGESAWFAEGVAGVYIILPMLGGGVRHCFTPLSGQHDALCFSPGIDAYVVQDPFSSANLFTGGHQFGFITADVDILWRHTYGHWLESDLGIKFGAGEFVDVRHRELTVPVVSLFGGVRF